MKRLLPAAAFLLVAAVHAQAPAPAPSVPSEPALRERVAAVHAAIGANDVEAWYAMTPPSSRRRLSLDAFKRDIRWDEVGAKSAPSTWKAGVDRVCSCRAGASTRCLLAVRVDIEAPGKDPVQDFPLETWDYEGGEWYLAYIGASTGGRCPGER